jgi:hypothetical protein
MTLFGSPATSVDLPGRVARLLPPEILQPVRRHDYKVDIAGGFRAAQLTSGYVVANGVHLPTRRRAYTRASDRRPILEMQMVAIDISDVTFT